MSGIRENITTRQPQRVGNAQPLSDDFGQAPLRAQKNVVNTISALAEQGGRINEAYAVKNKRADMLSDKMKYDIAKQEVMDKAKLDASATQNPTEVTRIYTEAKEKMASYATDKNDDDIPNVRWKDQVQSIKDDNAGFVVAMEGARLSKHADISKRETIANSEKTMNYAVRNWDSSGIRGAAQTLHIAGHITVKERDKWIESSLVKADKMQAKTLTDMMSSSTPEQARIFADDATKQIDLLTSLTDTEKNEVVAGFEKAVKLSAYYDDRNAAKTKKLADASSLALVQGAVGNYKNPELAASSIMAVYPDLGTKLVQAQARAIGQKDPEDAKFRTSLEWHQWSSEVGAYEKAGDKDGKKLAGLYVRSMGFGAYGERSMEMLHRVTTGENEGTMDAGDNAVIWGMVNKLTDDYIKEQGWGRRDVPADFKDPTSDDNLSKFNRTISQVDRAMYNLIKKVAKQGDMDLHQAVEYIESDSLYQMLRDNINVNDLRRKIHGVQTRETPQESPLQ